VSTSLAVGVDLDRPIVDLGYGLDLEVVAKDLVQLLPSHVLCEVFGHELRVVIPFLLLQVMEDVSNETTWRRHDATWLS
jgi:hypothetical protein